MRHGLYCLLLLLVSMTVMANSVIVDPVRLTMTSTQSTGMFELENYSSETVYFQAYVNQWQQINGKNVYQSTEEVVATPLIFTILPKKKQIIRIALLSSQPSKTERAYRIFFKQLPVPDKKKPQNKKTELDIKVLFNISSPIFIEPLNIFKKLNWHTENQAKKSLSLNIENQGNVHVLLTGIKITSTDNKLLWYENLLVYVLPHKKLHLDFKLPQSVILSKDDKVTLISDWGSETKAVNRLK